MNENEEGDEDGDDDMGIADEDEENEIDKLLKHVPLKKNKAKKQILISRAPKCICLHLKRFEQNGFRLSKVRKPVRYPLQLDLSPFMTENDDANECVYQLYGVSVHHGSMGGGHYIAYTHKHRSNGPKQGWYYFSDSTARAVGYEDALRAEGYVLFYQKCARKEVEDENEIDDDVE